MSKFCIWQIVVFHIFLSYINHVLSAEHIKTLQIVKILQIVWGCPWWAIYGVLLLGNQHHLFLREGLYEHPCKPRNVYFQTTHTLYIKMCVCVCLCIYLDKLICVKTFQVYLHFKMCVCLCVQSIIYLDKIIFVKNFQIYISRCECVCLCVRSFVYIWTIWRVHHQDHEDT